jgi:hypothetical protein
MLKSQANQVRYLATLALDRHGERAASFALYQALRFKNQGDLSRATQWREIARLAEETLRYCPTAEP